MTACISGARSARGEQGKRGGERAAEELGEEQGRDHLRRFFEADIYAIIHRTIEQFGESIGIRSRLDSFVDVEMLTHFYVVALAGMTESWLLGEIDRTPEELIQFVDTILNDQINGAAARV